MGDIDRAKRDREPVKLQKIGLAIAALAIIVLLILWWLSNKS